MKLTGEEPIGGNAGNERLAVVRGCRDDAVVLRHDVERMDKINVITAGDSLEKQGVGLFLDPFPPHVWNFEICIPMEADDFSGRKIETPLYAELFALGKKQLGADTASEERLVLSKRPAD